MESIEIFILVMVAVGAAIGIGYAYRVKQQRQYLDDLRTQREIDYQAKFARMRERARQEDAEREKLRQHPNYGNPQFNPMNPDVLMPVYKTGPVSDTAATISARKRVSNVPTSQTQIVSRGSVGIQSRGSVTYVDDSNDLLTSMILAQTMNHNNDSFAASVSYGNDDTPKVVDVPRETYRAPDPEPERSSYSSSYSSSSSDSSYSSSSSDSSYSSSSSDSSSSWD